MGQQELERHSVQRKLFISEKDTVVDHIFDALENDSVRAVGPEIIYGKLYDYIGFNAVKEDLFRYLVVARLAFPLSKLETIEYLYRYQSVLLHMDAIYLFLDKLHFRFKE